MDIGLAEFLKMFEARFGRIATTALLALIGLAVTALTLSVIWEHLVVPLYGFAGVIIAFAKDQGGFHLDGATIIRGILTVLTACALLFAATGTILLVFVMLDDALPWIRRWVKRKKKPPMQL